MKIEPVKNYKKPNYAMRIASVITAAGSLVGCNAAQLEGETSIVETEPATSDVELMGMIEPTEETCVEFDGDVVFEPTETEVFIDGDFIIVEEETTTEPTVTTIDPDKIEVPGMSLVETEETSPITNNRKKQTYTTAATSTEKKTTTVTENTTMTTTEVALDGTVPMYTQTTTRELADAGVVTTYTEPTAATTTEPELAGDIPIQTETTATEVTTAGVIPIYTETTTELELAGEPVLPME